ncbi:hypothetical protein NliqN6_3064 [Naganishia liquefaciens]|uniref:COP9 signalosome complex subunit 4 n=1 Tax=Naganishia liquefaciens TaxID=104408 RepID=A0A8H3TT38_9TREE|nr:hypothetical protein NliqN6_3064 [Naganishia liquefaciens]
MAIQDEISQALSGSDRSMQITSVLDILQRTLTLSIPPPSDVLVTFATHLINSENTPLIVGRSALTALVLALGAGLEIDLRLLKPSLFSSGQAIEKITPENALDADERKFYGIGKEVWDSKNAAAFEARKEVVEGIIGAAETLRNDAGSDSGRGWCDEQVTSSKHILSHILELEEDWLTAAKVLMGIQMETTSRVITEDQKLDVYMKIVRLLLECGESGQAQTYFNRASLLIHSTKDKATRLAFKLCQARLADFSRRFNEAAVKYHDLSFEQDIVEEERIFMLSAAVTCAILGPAGPQRSRVLANLYRDERTTSALPTYSSSILRKMFLDQILRVSEVKEFESQLQEHQLAKIPLDRRLVALDEEDGQLAVTGRKGPENVLDKAVMEHNILACTKVYDNIKFDGLGTLLDLTPYAAEAMARTMIEQGRLRAWIDQVQQTIFFEGRSQEEEDIQGTAGGLGVEREEKPVEGILLTERWDERIKDTSMKVEALANLIQQKNLLGKPDRAVIAMD